MDNIVLYLKLRYAVLILGLIFTATVLFAFLYFQWATSPKDLVPVASVCIALIALSYAVMTLHQNTFIRAEELRLKKLDYAMNFIELSSTPEMVKAFRISYGLREDVQENTPRDLVQLIDNDPEKMEALILVFNYFERLGIIIRLNAADEQALKEYYEIPVKQYWSQFYQWVNSKRTASHPKLFCEMEFLVNRWNA
jgi:hypothetical protein